MGKILSRIVNGVKEKAVRDIKNFPSNIKKVKNIIMEADKKKKAKFKELERKGFYID